MPSLINSRQNYLTLVELEQLRREELRRNANHPEIIKDLTFSEKYWDHPDQFVLDCFNWKDGESPTPYQLDILRKLVEKKKVAVRGPHGLGKCLWANSPVRLSDGSIVKANSLIGKEFEVLAVDKDLNVRVAKAHAWDNGIKDIVKITTDKGRVLERTLNHPIWGDAAPMRWAKPEFSNRLRPVGKWVEARELKAGSVVAVYLGNSVVKPYPLSDEAIKITAYLIGDGGLTGSSVVISQAPGPQLEEIKEISKTLGCDLVPKSSSSVYDFSITSSRSSRRFGKPGANFILTLMKDYGLRGLNSFEKKFPDWVWKLDNRQLAMFLSRLLACDGWAHSNKREDGRINKEIGFCTVSPQLADDVLSAFLRLGIQAEVRPKKTSWTHKGEKRFSTALCVNIHDVENILLFCERVGIFGKEPQVEALKKVCCAASLKEQQKWRGFNLPPNMRWERVTKLELIEAQPTIAITVPEYETFLTDFVEHNTSSVAWIVLWFALTRDLAGVDWKIPMTAGSWRQLTKFAWPEIHKWARRLKWDVIGRKPFHPVHELQKQSLNLTHGEAFAVASDNSDLIEGAHADQLLYIFDESKAIKEATFDAAEGAFSNTGANADTSAFALAVSTPGEPNGRFYNIHSRKPGFEDWWVRHVKFEELVSAKRATWEWANQRKKQWGEGSAIYANKVLGEFATSDEDGVIPLSWIELAIERFKDWQDELKAARKRGDPPEPLLAVGVDIGDSGGDDTVFACRYGYKIDVLRRYPKNDLMETTGKIVGILNANPKARAMVDGIGIGAGVVARLKELRQNVVSFVAGTRADLVGPDGSLAPALDRSGELQFINKRSHGWWNLRELLDPSNEFDIALPPDDMLIGDLTAPKWKVQSGGKIQVESKDDIRERIGRSTDAGDAVMQAFYPVPVYMARPFAPSVGGQRGPMNTYKVR